MRKVLRAVLVILTLLSISGCGSTPPAPTPTLAAANSPSPTHTPTRTPTPTPRHTPTITPTFTPSQMPSTTPTPTATLSPTPTSTPTYTPTPSRTPTSTPTPTPTTTPTPTPDLVVADFNSCAGVNNLNGQMGATWDEKLPGNSLAETYVPIERHGCVASLDYDIKSWAGFWLKLNGANLEQYNTMTFDVRAESSERIPEKIKIELKRECNEDGCKEAGILYTFGFSDQWQRKTVNLDDFGPTGYNAPLSSRLGMDELVFVFEADPTGPEGVVYLDNIWFWKKRFPFSSPAEQVSPTTLAGLVVADFNNCEGLNNLGGSMGVACATAGCELPNLLKEYCISEKDPGCVAKLDYNIEAFGAFWMKLEGADLTPYTTLSFDVRADPQWGIPGKIKVELKRACSMQDDTNVCKEISIKNFDGITGDWQRISLDLDEFTGTGWDGFAPVSEFKDMQELVFVLEAEHARKPGVIYLDNVTLEP